MLEKAQEDEIRKKVVERFGEDCVKRMDIHYMELNDVRMSAVDSFDYLEKVKAKYEGENTELLLAGLLYGMKLGEMGYEYHLKQMQQEKEEADKLDLKKKEEEAAEEAKRKKLEAEWEAADAERKKYSFERDYQ
jgi:uncharacterized protein HemX